MNYEFSLISLSVSCINIYRDRRKSDLRYYDLADCVDIRNHSY